MKEIGGFLELELPGGELLHPAAQRLNSGRSCLRVLISTLKIEKLWLPAYTCAAVWESAEREGCRAELYDIGPDFLPRAPLPEDDWVLFTNYFGVCSGQVEAMRARHPKLLVDNVQAYFSADDGSICFYSPRKFFGVPDGGQLMLDAELPEELPRGVSCDRASHLLKRIDLGSGAAFADFQKNDALLDGLPVERMSRLTERLLEGIDYEAAAARRKRNFALLHEALGGVNTLTLELRDGDVPMVYPLLLKENGAELRRRLIEARVYVASYWPGQRDGGFGRRLEQELLPLPIDQRYGDADMRELLSRLASML